MKNLLLKLLIFASYTAVAGDLGYSFGVDNKKDITFSVSNHNTSVPILIRDFEIRVGNRQCLSKSSNIKLMPNEYIPSEILDLESCFGVNKTFEFAGIADNSNSIAIINKYLLRKDAKVKVNYIIDSSKSIESMEIFSLLFVQNQHDK